MDVGHSLHSTCRLPCETTMNSPAKVDYTSLKILVGEAPGGMHLDPKAQGFRIQKIRNGFLPKRLVSNSKGFSSRVRPCLA